MEKKQVRPIFRISIWDKISEDKNQKAQEIVVYLDGTVTGMKLGPNQFFTFSNNILPVRCHCLGVFDERFYCEKKSQSPSMQNSSLKSGLSQRLMSCSWKKCECGSSFEE